MLDIKLIRENPDTVRKDLDKRGDDEKKLLLEELIKKDKEWRKLQYDNQELKSKRNKISQKIALLKKSGKPAEKELKEASKIPDKIKENDERIGALQESCNKILLRLPNILHKSVPIGKDDSENKQIKKSGKIPKFTFKPKNHLDILEALGLIESAADVSGHGFFYLKDKLVLLDIAIQKFALDFMIKKGYTLVNPPYMLHKKPYEGVTDLADFEDVLYKIQDDDLYLIATSEHPLAALFMNKTILKKQLPIKLIGISPCFRKEVGTHGKYTKGLFRMHQFNKIEQFIFCHPDNSWKLHEELQKNAEQLYKLLEIPYRVVNVCTGDIGIVAAKKYDIEFYMADGQYREISSNSNCTDYQARRLNIKFREKEGQSPAGFVHTLNSTALATSRTLVGLIENHQQKDGSVKIPKALWKYTGFKVLK